MTEEERIERLACEWLEFMITRCGRRRCLLMVKYFIWSEIDG